LTEIDLFSICSICRAWARAGSNEGAGVKPYAVKKRKWVPIFGPGNFGRTNTVSDSSIKSMGLVVGHEAGLQPTDQTRHLSVASGAEVVGRDLAEVPA
jgi:hypothetical protein